MYTLIRCDNHKLFDIVYNFLTNPQNSLIIIIHANVGFLMKTMIPRILNSYLSAHFYIAQ